MSLLERDEGKQRVDGVEKDGNLCAAALFGCSTFYQEEEDEKMRDGKRAFHLDDCGLLVDVRDGGNSIKTAGMPACYHLQHYFAPLSPHAACKRSAAPF